MKDNKRALITEVLKNWYFIDSVLLNDHAKYCITDDKDYDEYISLKAALLSDLYEFYVHIGHSPTIKVPKNHRKLQEMAVHEARKTKFISARMIESPQFKTHMAKLIKEKFNVTPDKDFDSISEQVIQTRFAKMCLDNVLVGAPIIKCENQNKTSDFKGQMLEQAYLTVRSELVKIASKYSVNEGAGSAFVTTVLGFTLIAVTARAIEAGLNRCTNRCGIVAVATPAAKNACVLKCKIQTQQKIISALRQSAAQTNNPESRNKFAKDVKRAQLRMTQYQRQLAKILATRAGADEVEASDKARLF